MNEKPIRVAQVIGKWLGGGVESVIMNYYRYIDKNKIQFDFICDSDSKNIPYTEIEKLGGKVIIVSPYKKIFKYEKELTKVFKQNKYDIVHSNINSLSILPLRCAKKAGIKIRIAHSHSTSNKKEWKRNIIKNILRPFSKVYATHYFACSELAGKWLFGNKTFNAGKIKVVKNAIELEKFKFNENIRNEKRQELNIDKDTIVIGNVGRFVDQKNHKFLIKIFKQYNMKNNNSVLLLVGQGPLEDKIKDQVKNLNLSNKVIFLGQRTDVNDLYQAMDIFILPSLYEGLGMVLIEAQVAGLPCIASVEVPNEASISKLISYKKLDNIDIWCNEIENCIKKIRLNQNINNFEYDINIECKKLEKLYADLYNGK